MEDQRIHRVKKPNPLLHKSIKMNKYGEVPTENLGRSTIIVNKNVNTLSLQYMH